MPETVVRGKDRNGGPEIKLSKGEAINVSLRDLLDVAGVDLDGRLDDQPNLRTLPEAAKDKNDEYPRVRLSGVNIIMSFEYYHRALAPNPYTETVLPKSDDVICLVEVEPQYASSFHGTNARYQVSDINQPFFVTPGSTGSNAPNDDIESILVNFRRHGVQLSFQVSGQHQWYSSADVM